MRAVWQTGTFELEISPNQFMHPVRLLIPWLAVLLLGGLTARTGQASAWRPGQPELLSPAELERAWSSFQGEAGGAGLMLAVQKRGFIRQTGPAGAWGFRGIDGQGQPIFLCVWSCESRTSREQASCALLWVQKGRKHYKAYLCFPENMTDLRQAEEWQAGARGEPVAARAWQGCFRNGLLEGVCESTCNTRSSHSYCYPNAFLESYTFHGRVRLFSLRTYLYCLAARCGEKAQCLLAVAVDCGYGPH